MKFTILAALAATMLSTTAMAAPTVDGTVDAEYAQTASVATDPSAPTSNFGNPGNTATAGYNIFLTSANDKLFGAVSQTGGTAAGTFANLYFDINPGQGFGSEFVIEVQNMRGGVAGGPANIDLSGRIMFASNVANGLTTSEFSIDNSVFRDFITGAAALGVIGTPNDIRLNLSQSLSYSVAGGATYGDNRLGRFSAAVAAVPEPATWGMMLIGFGMMGASMRYRRRETKVVYA
jgi:hypothetical protein